jgi:glycosyltransferase involved in cell wall biosynthesis
MGDLISVILPVYNGEQYIEDSIRSILGQTHQNFELIIINDGSTDNSDKIIKGFLKSNKIIYKSRKNKGLVNTLNEGIKLSSGSYIARMDQDDISYPKRLEKQLNFMQKNNIDVCGTSYHVINEQGKIIKTVESHKNNFEIILSAMMVPFIHPSVMFRNIFKEKNIFYGNNNKVQAEDYDLWIRLIKMNLVFGNINEILIKYRLINTSMTSVNYIKIYKEVYKICNEFNKEYKEELLISFMKINKSLVQKKFLSIMFKSIFNFIKVNGINSKILIIFIRFNLKYSSKGLILFLKQEINYFLNNRKYIIKNYV